MSGIVTVTAIGQHAEHGYSTPGNFGGGDFEGSGLKFVKSCSQEGTFYSVVQPLDVGCVSSIYPQCKRHTVTDRRADRQTDRQTDNVIMPMVDHTASSNTIG